MSLTGGLQGLHFINTMSNADLKRKAAEAEGIIGTMGKNIGKLAPFAPLAAGSLILAKLGNDAYDFSNEFSKAMREVQTISQATQEDWEGMSKSIIDMAANGPDDAIQLAQAYYQIASAGYDGAAGLNLLDVSSRAATAGITDTKTAADGLTTILNAWGKDATEAEQVADVLFKTVEKGKTTFPELAQNIAQVAPMASAMKISLEEILGATASLTKQGNTTSMAMTQIRQAIIGLNENLGDGWSEAMTFQEALQAVRDMAGGSDTALKDMMGRIEGVNAVLALTGDKAIAAADDLKTLSEATGSMQTAYETMMEEADNKWSQVHNKWQRELSQVGDSLKVASSGIADFFNRILTDEQADVIGPASQSAINGFFSDLNQLDDKEAKLKLITDKIIELKNEYVSLGQESAQWEKVQPSWLQRQAENFNAALGFGPATLTGRYNQANLEIVQKDIAINQAVQKKLEELYQQVLSSAGGSGSGGGGGDKPKPWTVGESQAEIERLKEQLGTVSIEQEVELRFKIADEQAKVDEFYGKVRDRFEQAINESWETPFNRTVGADGTNSKLASRGNASKMIEDQAKVYKEQLKEIQKQLKPMEQLTDEGAEQLRIEEAKIKAQLEQIENLENLSKALYDSSEMLGAVSYAVGEINSDAGEAVGRLADIARNAGGVIANWSTDPVSALSSGIGVIGNIIGLFSKDMKSSIDVLNESLELTQDNLRLLASLNDSLNGNDWAVVAQARIEVLNKNISDTIELLNQLDVYQADFQTGEREKVDTSDWGANDWIREFSSSGLITTSTEELRLYIEQLSNYKSELDGLSDSMQNNALGFNADDIASTIFSGIEDGLKLSENGLGDWSDNFGDLIRNALMQNIATALNADFIEGFMKDFNTYMSDGLLDSDERRALEEQFIAGVQKGEEYISAMESIVGQYQTDVAAEGIQGIQRSITEETGSLIVGQFSSMREYQVRANDTMMDQLSMAEEQLEVLQDIRDNTSYNHNLDGMHEELRTMNQTLKTGLSV